MGVELKASATVRARDFTGLAHLRDRVGARLRAGLVVYAGQRTLPFGNRLWALPFPGSGGPDATSGCVPSRAGVTVAGSS
jgi:hypothetical protein